MELRPVYKKTEIGVIPEDWEVAKLPDVLQFISGKAHERYIVECGPYVAVNSKFISSDGEVVKYSKENFCPAKINDILMVMSDLPNGKALAKCFIVDVPNKYAINQRVCILRSKGVDPNFFYYQLNRNPYFLAFDDGVSQTHLLNGVFLKCPVVVPPILEQEAIAEALSDVDASIAALSRLIAKKRDLRQGAMQRLLTGKTRLPGFTAPWQEKRLGQLGDIRSGGTPSTADPAFWDGGIPWCTPTDITALSGRKTLQVTARTISARGLSASSAEIIPPRSLIVTSRATIGACAINSVPMTTNQGFKNIVPNAETDVDFLYYLMGAQTARLIALCGGSTFLEIGKKQLSAFELVLPYNKVEQTAIAAVLSDMDAEIDALDARLDKTRALKQAMMQALLTGRVRLPVRGDAAPRTKEAAHA